MPTPAALLIVLPLAMVVATPLAARDQSSANSFIDRLGGGGPGGQSAVRGFFMGIAFGVLLAVVCCCWWPCVHMRRAQRRAAARRILRMGRGERETTGERDAAPAETIPAEGQAEPQMTTAAERTAPA